MEKSESNDSFDVSIKLSCQDRIEGYAQWSKQAQQEWDYENDLADELALSIKGKASVSSKIFSIKFSAGADLEAKSGFKIEAIPKVINGNLAIKPRLHFNGLHVKWAYHLQATSGNKPNKRSFGGKHSDNELKGESVHHSTLITPKTWPDQVKPFYSNRGVL